jgi:hypothetical protein
MELFYRKERDRDFFNVCESIRRKYGAVYVSVENIVKESICREAQSFYLHPGVYARIVHRVGKEQDIAWLENPVKKALYIEIYRRYLQIRKEHPSWNAMDCARIIAGQKAPRFYLSEGHATNLYYKLLKSKKK